MRRLLLALLLGVLAVACLTIVKPFLASIVWATILVYVSWPAYRLMRRPFGRFNSAAAASMTILLLCAVVVPVLWTLVLVRDEFIEAYQASLTYLARGSHPLPASIRGIPWVGEQVQHAFDLYTADPSALGREIGRWMPGWPGELAGLVSGLGRNLAKLLIAMLTVYFFYRDGESIAAQTRRVIRRFFADRLDVYIDTAGKMTRAVLYGFILTGLAQGLIAGIGYAVLDIPAPALLGALTALLSPVPLFGTTLVWGTVGAELLLTGQVRPGIIMLLWGTFLVHPVDNVLRPLLISNVTHVPFLTVMFGALGGLAAFGLVGVFVGPVILAVALALWQEWASQSPPG